MLTRRRFHPTRRVATLALIGALVGGQVFVGWVLDPVPAGAVGTAATTFGAGTAASNNSMTTTGGGTAVAALSAAGGASLTSSLSAVNSDSYSGITLSSFNNQVPSGLTGLSLVVEVLWRITACGNCSGAPSGSTHYALMTTEVSNDSGSTWASRISRNQTDGSLNTYYRDSARLTGLTSAQLAEGALRVRLIMNCHSSFFLTVASCGYEVDHVRVWVAGNFLASSPVAGGGISSPLSALTFGRADNTSTYASASALTAAGDTKSTDFTSFNFSNVIPVSSTIGSVTVALRYWQTLASTCQSVTWIELYAGSTQLAAGDSSTNNAQGTSPTELTLTVTSAQATLTRAAIADGTLKVRVGMKRLSASGTCGSLDLRFNSFRVGVSWFGNSVPWVLSMANANSSGVANCSPGGVATWTPGDTCNLSFVTRDDEGLQSSGSTKVELCFMYYTGPQACDPNLNSVYDDANGSTLAQFRIAPTGAATNQVTPLGTNQSWAISSVAQSASWDTSTITWDISVRIGNIARAGPWYWVVTVYDEQGLSGQFSAPATVPTYTAITAAANIDFGSLAAGATSTVKSSAQTMYCNTLCRARMNTGTFTNGSVTATPKSSIGSPGAREVKLRCSLTNPPPDLSLAWIGTAVADLDGATAIPAMSSEATDAAKTVYCMLTNGNNPPGTYSGTVTFTGST